MSELADIQRLLGELLRQSKPLSGSTQREALARVVAGNERLSPEEQAEIYREQFWLRHRDALYDDYPGLAYLLGDDAFEALVRAYLAAHPPASWTLRDVGDRLPAFAADYPGFESDVAAPARDMARFEAAFIDAFDGPDVPPLELAKATALGPDDWPRARVRLHPLLVLMALDYPVHDLRSRVRDGDMPSRHLAPKPTCVALWRGDDLRVYHRTVDRGELEVLTALREGCTLPEACARAPGAGDRLQRWFSWWARRGWIVDVSLEA